ncbi:DUF4089 domain-containing protein [Meridianimarinicoccus sp. RP-17]|uniref:DUF4089 domain-containing protein n=1 Tax=Meridianimarinicoccus zhengii TaxID=2056810 RepID=UPI000DAD0A1C|nr:DUF4089 domain-containing protein [Phycocomes zhengii]
MTAAPSDPDHQIDAASAMVGLPIAAAWRPGVWQFLVVARQMTDILEAVPLADDDLALAPVFRLPRPTGNDADA